MDFNLSNENVTEKTKELCGTIISQPDFLAVRQHIQTFMGDETAKQMYQALAEKSETLQHKQQHGERLSPEEIADFNQCRDALMQNAVAANFMAAQEQIHHLQHSVGKYVAKTLEIGRVPTEEDFESCGHGCSCGH